MIFIDVVISVLSINLNGCFVPTSSRTLNGGLVLNTLKQNNLNLNFFLRLCTFKFILKVSNVDVPESTKPVPILTYVPCLSPFLSVIRVIPQETVDNNLGPDHLAGPKALDPKYCRQPTL